MPEKVGKVVQVIGPVVDIKFKSDENRYGGEGLSC